MTDRMKRVAVLVAFIALLALVFVNQQTTGWLNLGLMLVGLVGLIGLLALYNRRYR